MHLLRGATLSLVVLLAADAPLQTAWPPLVPAWKAPIQIYPARTALRHDIGGMHSSGWHADYRADRPGFLARELVNGGATLPPGIYEYDFYFALRPGHLPGLLSDANDIVRIDAFDATTHERLLARSFQRADFPTFHQRRLIRKSIVFSTLDRADHRIEPRAYWPGLASLAIMRVELRPIITATPDQLAAEAESFESLMDPTFLERGYVVVRGAHGQPEDLGDAAIWTGLYAASEAWRYRTTHAPQALERMQASLWALHALTVHSPTAGTLVRYVEADDDAWPLPPSKDTYTGFFFAMAQCMPLVRSAKLRHALQDDIGRLAGHFLDHDLTFEFSPNSSVNLNPYLPAAFFDRVIRDLREEPGDARRLTLILHALQAYFWMHGQRPVPSIGHLNRFAKHPDRSWQPTATELLTDGTKIIRQVQENVHRSARAGQLDDITQTPYQKLDVLLLRAQRQLDELAGHRPLREPDQVKVLPSEALLALHILKVAAEFAPEPGRFRDYYEQNLWNNKALLGTAVAWSQMDEDLIGAVLGESFANASRSNSSHLTFLALYDLAELESDPYRQFRYKEIFERQVAPMRSDGNAMLQAMENRMGLDPSQAGLTLWSLSHYPQDRLGKGDAYWAAHRTELTQRFGGPVAGKARDPLPPDLRPRDAFLWQRNARDLRGDQKDWLYPPMDFLFAYWLSRLGGPVRILEAPPDERPSRRISDSAPGAAPPLPSP